MFRLSSYSLCQGCTSPFLAQRKWLWGRLQNYVRKSPSNPTRPRTTLRKRIRTTQIANCELWTNLSDLSVPPTPQRSLGKLPLASQGNLMCRTGVVVYSVGPANGLRETVSSTMKTTLPLVTNWLTNQHPGQDTLPPKNTLNIDNVRWHGKKGTYRASEYMKNYQDIVSLVAFSLS